jgi:hypothetical protein
MLRNAADPSERLIRMGSSEQARASDGDAPTVSG